MTIKLKFYYRNIFDEHDEHNQFSQLVMARTINDLPVGEPHPYYILSGAISDFLENRHGEVDNILSVIDQLEYGEIDSYEYEGQGFTQHITRDRVRFEHTIFGECPEWPVWSCTFKQYKVAMKGYRQFLSMPRNIKTELTVELPENNHSLT